MRIDTRYVGYRFVKNLRSRLFSTDSVGAERYASLLPFEAQANYKLEDAKETFLKFHQRNFLSPGRHVLREEHSWYSALLPFWAFKGSFKVEYSAEVGASENDAEKKIKWKVLSWRPLGGGQACAGFEEEEMQIYGDFEFRHSFVNRLKPGGYIKNAKPVQWKQLSQKLHVYPVTMPRYIAWNLVCRNALRKKKKDVQTYLEDKYQHVRNVRVHVKALPHYSKIIYTPLYVLLYIYGERINIHGKKLPNNFCALLSATDGRISSDKHISVPRAALLGGFSCCATMLSMEFGDMYLQNKEPMWSFYDYLFSTSGVAALSGLLAQIMPHLQRQKEEDKVLECENEIILDVGTNDINTLEVKEYERINIEWARWEQSSNDSWDPEKRQRWAQNLWINHQYRLKAMRSHHAQNEEFDQRARENEEREKRRKARWGPSERQRDQVFIGNEMQNVRKRDYLGYYEVLGLDPSNFITPHDVKNKFYKAVLLWHPDRQTCPTEKARAKTKFQFLVKAYDVLKHPEKKKKYDIGEWKEMT